MNQKGLSLLEIIISIGILGLVLVSTLELFGYGYQAFFRDDRFTKQQSDINQFVSVFRRDFEQATDVVCLDNKTLVLGFIKDKGNLNVNNNSFDHRASNMKIKIYQFSNVSLRIKAVDAPVRGLSDLNGQVQWDQSTLKNEYCTTWNDTNVLAKQIDVSNSEFDITSMGSSTASFWRADALAKLIVKIKPQNTNTGTSRNANLKNSLWYEFSLYGKYQEDFEPNTPS